MKGLLIVCYASSIILFSILFVVLLVMFFTSVYSCFSKKIQGKLSAKIGITFLVGCVCPWVLLLVTYLIGQFRQLLML